MAHQGDGRALEAPYRSLVFGGLHSRGDRCGGRGLACEAVETRARSSADFLNLGPAFYAVTVIVETGSSSPSEWWLPP